MAEIKVGMRDLKNRLSEYFRQVKNGESLIVTERGEIIAQIIPPQRTVEERLWAMVRMGLADWNGKRPKRHYQPRIVNNTGQQISDLIIEDRR